MADYLQTMPRAFDLPVRLNARVTSLVPDRRRLRGHVPPTAPSARGRWWWPPAPSRFRSFRRPPRAGPVGDPDSTVRSYRNPEALPDGPALVVGGGNSGFQIAEELAATQQVDLSIGIAAADAAPAAARPGPVLVAHPARPACGSPSIRGSAGEASREFSSASQRRRLRRVGVTIPAATGRGSRANSAVRRRQHSRRSEWWSGRPGYRSDYTWIDIPGVGGRPGRTRPRRDRDPRPVLPGLSWQHTRGSALLGFVQADAVFIVEPVSASAVLVSLAPASSRPGLAAPRSRRPATSGGAR